MKVAILHYTAPPIPGGVETVMLQHIRLLREAGHEVTVVVGEGGPVPIEGVHLHVLPEVAATSPNQITVSRQLAVGDVTPLFSHLKDLLFNQIEPVLCSQDVIIVHNAFTLHFNEPLTAALAKMVELELAGRVLAWTHDIAAVNPLYQADFHNGYPWTLLTQPVPGVRYVCISTTRRDELREMWASQSGGHRSEEPLVIYNGVDPAQVLNVPQYSPLHAIAAELLRRDVVVLLPVRITRRKNIELAIDVVSVLGRRGYDAVLVITGPTAPHHPQRSRTYLESLKVRVGELDMTENVLFLAETLGRSLSEAELSNIFSLSDLLFLPSQSEGFGLPILEAALHRLPIVASDLPVFRELVGGDDAAFFPLDASPQDIADTVWRVGRTPEKRVRQDTVTRFAWSQIYWQEIEPLLTRLAAPQRVPES